MSEENDGVTQKKIEQEDSIMKFQDKNVYDSTIQRVHNMCQLIWQKQKTLERSNLEIVERLQSAEEEIWKISQNDEEDAFKEELIEEGIVPNDEKDSLDGLKAAVQNVEGTCSMVLEQQETIKMDIFEKFRLVEEKVEKLSQEYRENFESKQSTIDENDAITSKIPEKSDVENSMDSTEHSPTYGKSFVLKNTFENVSYMKDNARYYSKEEEHFGVSWKFFLEIEENQLMISLQCMKPLEDNSWNITTEASFELISKNGSRHKEVRVADLGNEFGTIGDTIGPIPVLEWLEIEEEYLVDDKLIFEVHVGIDWMSGVYKNNLRDFGETMKQFSDVTLNVRSKKFNVSKLFLSAQSPYFSSLFSQQLEKSRRSEIKLTGIDADDFQNYLELLYGEQSIDEFTVEGILLVAYMYETKMVIQKCEEFLMDKTRKTLKKKLEMSARYNLEALKKKCLGEIKSIADIKSVISGNVHDMDSSIMADLFQISLEFH